MAARGGREEIWREQAVAVADPEQPGVAMPRSLLHEVFQHAIECYPEEACGLLLGPAAAEPQTIERCTNVQRRRKLSGDSELDAGHGYWIDETELLRAIQRAEREGTEIRVIYHSHVDTGAYFSRADLEGAIGPHGEPNYPGAIQLVLSVHDDGVRDAAAFIWTDGRFVGRVLQETGR